MDKSEWISSAMTVLSVNAQSKPSTSSGRRGCSSSTCSAKNSAGENDDSQTVFDRLDLYCAGGGYRDRDLFPGVWRPIDARQQYIPAAHQVDHRAAPVWNPGIRNSGHG